MRVILIFVALTVILGCQSTPRVAQPKQIEIYSHISCSVKNNNFGDFNSTVIINKDFSEFEIDGEVVSCISNRDSSCKATRKISGGYEFYSISAYTYKYPGSGFLDYAEIIDGMIARSSYTEMECNRI